MNMSLVLPELDNVQVFECAACIITGTPMLLEVFGIKSFGNKQCCLPCQHPVIEFGPTSDNDGYTISSGPTANRV